VGAYEKCDKKLTALRKRLVIHTQNHPDASSATDSRLQAICVVMVYSSISKDSAANAPTRQSEG
jgi:hypothetical protein